MERCMMIACKLRHELNANIKNILNYNYYVNNFHFYSRIGIKNYNCSKTFPFHHILINYFNYDTINGQPQIRILNQPMICRKTIKSNCLS